MSCKIKMGNGYTINFSGVTSEEDAFRGSKPQNYTYITKARCSGKSVEALIDRIKSEIQFETQRQPFGILSHNTDFMDAMSYSLAEYKNEWVTIDGRELQEEKKYMKIKFIYDNERTYMATGVVNYRDYHDHVYYNQEKDTGLLKTDSDIEVSKSDLLAYVVYNGNATTIVKVGNCKLNFDVEDLAKRKQKAKTVPTENYWIVWESGECPVEKGTLIDVKYRDGWLENSVPALMTSGDWDHRSAVSWYHHGGISDIVAYRLSKGEK